MGNNSIIEILIWGTNGRPWKVDLGEWGEYGLHEMLRMYAPTYKSAEKQLRNLILSKGDDNCPLYGSIHHVEMNERPFGVFHCAGDVLSTRIYDKNGKEVDRSIVSSIPDENGELPRFPGRAFNEYRFKPGDIVEVQSGETVSCWVVIDIPPSSERAAKLGLCDYSDDCYTVVQTGDYMASHEHIVSVGVFKPRYKVPDDVAEKLNAAYADIVKTLNQIDK